MSTLEILNKHRQALILKQRSMKGVMLGSGWIVTTATGTPLKVETVKEGDRYTVTSVTHASYSTWSMFKEEDARTLAADVRDGHGNQGRAMHINTYLQEARAEVEQLIAELSK